jgi:hypothetical protein
MRRVMSATKFDEVAEASRRRNPELRWPSSTFTSFWAAASTFESRASSPKRNRKMARRLATCCAADGGAPRRLLRTRSVSPSDRSRTKSSSNTYPSENARPSRAEAQDTPRARACRAADSRSTTGASFPGVLPRGCVVAPRGSELPSIPTCSSASSERFRCPLNSPHSPIAGASPETAMLRKRRTSAWASGTLNAT